MGIAKSIEAYAVYHDYTENTELFIKNLSDKLDADFIVNTYDHEYDSLHKIDQLTAYSKTNKYRLTINYYVNKKTDIPVYNLTLPINFEYENSIELSFRPNQSVHIMFLTFEHLWRSLIDVLKFENLYEERQRTIEKYEKLRTEYISIFKKLDIKSIFIVTDAHYKVEDIVYERDYPFLTFSDIPKIAKKLDNLTSFDLEKILRTDKVSDLCKDFLDCPDLNIALIDNLNSL